MGIDGELGIVILTFYCRKCQTFRESRVGSVIDPYVPIIQLWRQCFANIVPTIYHSFFFFLENFKENFRHCVYIVQADSLLLHHLGSPHILCCISYVILYSQGKYLLCFQIYEDIFIHHAMMIFPTIIKIAQQHKLLEHSEKKGKKCIGPVSILLLMMMILVLLMGTELKMVICKVTLTTKDDID